MKFVSQSLLLLLSFAFVFVWQQLKLTAFTIPLIALFIAIFLILSVFRKSTGSLGKTLESEGSWSIFFLTSIVLLVVITTGTFNSAFFFLLYFLGFGLALVFEPGVVFVYMLSLLLLFFPSTVSDDVMGNSLKIGSVILISPLAFFFGIQFRREQAQEKEIAGLKKALKKTKEEEKELEKIASL